MEVAYTPGNVTAAAAAYSVQTNYRLKELSSAMVTSHGVQRPELGMFVFGVLQGGANWEFYAATATSAVGRQKTGHTYFGFINSGVTNKTIMDNIVLGAAARFWP
jgi:hypothetical protein